MVASRLGVAVPSVNNANAIKTVRGLIRSRHMAHSRFLKATFDQGNYCAKCGWMLVRKRTKLQRPELCDTPCCGSDEHLGCSILEICRCCNTHLKRCWHVLYATKRSLLLMPQQMMHITWHSGHLAGSRTAIKYVKNNCFSAGNVFCAM